MIHSNHQYSLNTILQNHIVIGTLTKYLFGFGLKFQLKISKLFGHPLKNNQNPLKCFKA
jgi:hypothetical protein